MDIKTLIELIVESTPPVCNSRFTFILEDTGVECSDHYFMETHEAICVDEAVTFLFDCDIHLWELVSIDVDTPINSAVGIYWRIKLIKR